jgi:hypothetical protein
VQALHIKGKTHAVGAEGSAVVTCGRDAQNNATRMQTHVAGSEGDLDDTAELGELLCGVGLNVGDACGLQMEGIP